MGQKILIGPMNKGLRTDVTPFNVDNDSFPQLTNAYQWRGRIKRKRGTELLCRLSRYFNSTSTAFNPGTTTQVLSAGAGNLFTGFASSGIQTTASIVPGTVTINDITSVITYTDPSMDGTLSGGSGGTINYATGAIAISGGGGNTINASFIYYPTLPVMGLETANLDPTGNLTEIGFDTTYAYNIANTSPYNSHSVSFYMNPVGTGLSGYVAKSTWTPLNWNGQNYRQFWSTSYESAFWATNGIAYPFSGSNIGMQYKAIVSTTIVAGGPPAQVTLEITGHGLIVGDFVFINEVATTTGINFQTGYVTTVTDIDNVIVTFPNATIGGSGTGGIAQYLTRSADTTKDCLRYYTGSPVSSAVPPVFTQGNGWVNFCPPLSSSDFSISGLPQDQYYLVGARMILPFKDRLLFFGPVVQTSSANSQVYLQDTVIYSQNGTPYYTCSFTGNPATTVVTFNPLLTPSINSSGTIFHSAAVNAWWEDTTGLGGFIQAGFQSDINTVSPNEDVLIIGFGDRQSQLVFTGDDITPFVFLVINSELGSGATFSLINLDRGVMTVGSRGFIITSQIESKRFDLDIPDSVFQIQLTSNGNQRVCAARDFVNEWIYFTTPSPTSPSVFPTQTLQYNYRDQSWALFNETYTTYGLFRKVTGYTWATIGDVYPTWVSWTAPWNSGSSTLLQPEVSSGNTQGFVLIRGKGTNEGNSLVIQSISESVSGSLDTITVTSPNHCLNEGDYIVISGCLGTISSVLNGKVFSVANITTHTFSLNPQVSSSGTPYTYLGGGLIKRMYVPFIQTKQFPIAWDMARKTRIGPQMYLLTTTANAQTTLFIYLSQDAADAYNQNILDENSSLIYSTILYSCPESTNLGLIPANTNLQQLNYPGLTPGTGGISPSAQMWHRINTSLIGDTIQFALTLSDEQMRDETLTNQFSEIELHSVILDVSPSQFLA